MALLLALLFFAFGLYLIIRGGELLVNSAIDLGRATGISQVVLGATVIAVATTAPEIVISVIAVFDGNYGMAVGNAIGGMTANIALVMAVYVILMPTAVSRRDVATKSIFLLGSLVLLFFVAFDLNISLLEGMFLIAAACGFLIYSWVSAKNREKSLEPQQCLYCGYPLVSKKSAVYKLLLGQLVLILGAAVLVRNGERIAAGFGISETVVGFTIIAIGTSAPELVTIITAIKKKSSDLALGNILGSNIINATLLLGMCGVAGYISGFGMPLTQHILLVGLPFLLVASLLTVVPMILWGRTYRWQGVVLLTMYVGYALYLTLAQPL